MRTAILSTNARILKGQAVELKLMAMSNKEYVVGGAERIEKLVLLRENKLSVSTMASVTIKWDFAVEYACRSNNIKIVACQFLLKGSVYDCFVKK